MSIISLSLSLSLPLSLSPSLSPSLSLSLSPFPSLPFLVSPTVRTQYLVDVTRRNLLDALIALTHRFADSSVHHLRHRHLATSDFAPRNLLDALNAFLYSYHAHHESTIHAEGSRRSRRHPHRIIGKGWPDTVG